MKRFDPRRTLRRLLPLALASRMMSGAALAEKLVTEDDIYRVAPNAKPDLVAAILAAEDEFAAAGIDTRLRMAHFLSQVFTETGGLNRRFPGLDGGIGVKHIAFRFDLLGAELGDDVLGLR